jgi:hypothetical protein
MRADRFKNIYPTLARSDNPMTKTLIIVILVLHGAMAVGIKMLFM